MVIFDEEKQNKKLEELRKEEEENLAQVLSGKFGAHYIDLTRAGINSDALRVVTLDQAKDASLAVFDIVGKKIRVAVLAPENEKTVALLSELRDKGYIATIYMASRESLQKVWARYQDLSYSSESKSGALDVSNEDVTAYLNEVHSLEDVKALVVNITTQKKGYKISRLLEILVAGALALKASDIHVEPEDDDVKVRYRLDGVLTEITRFDKDTYHLLLSRLKLLSGMKLNVPGAQDGRFSIVLNDSEIEIRSSVLPSAYEDSVVLRVLNPNSIAGELEDLGIPPRLLEVLKREIDRPEGMILTTGPTGSGKTTTLYAFLRKIYTPEIKIITIENPIEYHLQGITQTQVDPDKNYTFLEGLRSALRQDPDIIMVGEIRDKETAEIAVNSALTGHLVFSTLHTNNAAGTFPRLIDLGANPKTLTSAVSVSMAQRLVRKLCDACKKEVPLEGKNREIVERVIASLPMKEDFPGPIPEKIFEPAGCPACNNSGYRGRIGLYEAILRSADIEKAVRENPSERDIWNAAKNQGMLTMRQDGIIKLLKGITSLPELSRVIDIEGDY